MGRSGGPSVEFDMIGRSDRLTGEALRDVPDLCGGRKGASRCSVVPFGIRWSATDRLIHDGSPVY